MSRGPNDYSYSKLECYESCPFKFKINYIDKKTCFVGNIATEFGLAIHQTEEAIANEIQAGSQINYIQIKNELLLKFLNIEHKYKFEYNAPDTKSGRTYKEKAYHYLEHEIYNLENFMKAHPTYEIIGIEKHFDFVYDENHSFNGSIDRVFHDKTTNKYLIQDIKSWAVPKDEKELTTPLQFVVYTLAAKELWGAEPDQVICEYYLPLVDGGITQSAGTDGFINRGITKLEKLFESIKNKEYKPKPSPLCNYCNYCKTNPDAPDTHKYLCPYFSLWERTTRNKFDISKHENEWQGIENNELILEAYHKKYNIK